MMHEPFAPSLPQHIQWWRAKGLPLEDEQAWQHYLLHCNSYRLRDYARFFETPEGRYPPGTRLADIVARYETDQALRLVLPRHFQDSSFPFVPPSPTD